MESKDSNNRFVFAKENYIYLIAGIVLNIIGFTLMQGGGAEDPNAFNAEELFSEVRLTVAPILIILGYAVIIWGIMKKPRNSGSTK
ncbi:Protein of unknown function [Lishizhenia tianjinensis]|uniref:DUF3098 domain-containing protein n=1 Tax=Lishizhenia tianjinensis TaxID=477690 RepID=A0A1I7B5D0_9FLAO|nr:DUF3098 domain-containing protein [Lishizhenia tianjinensis]SFT82314.1 Protein of unknown function [Lishizhenia tianjinensis]